VVRRDRTAVRHPAPALATALHRPDLLGVDHVADTYSATSRPGAPLTMISTARPRGWSPPLPRSVPYVGIDGNAAHTALCTAATRGLTPVGTDVPVVHAPPMQRYFVQLLG
jgi:hypothetical protein